MNALTPLERAVLEECLIGSDPALDVLRRQVDRCRVVRREMTGVGFFSDLAVSGPIERAPLPGTSVFEGVSAIFPSMKHGAGFLLYVQDGVLDQLEGFSYDEPWPDSEAGFMLSRVTQRSGPDHE